MKQKFEGFLKNSWGLEIRQKNQIIFRSKKSGVKGLLDFVNKYGRRHNSLVIFDKIIGRGAALLAIHLKAEEVYGVTGSKLAAKTLREYKIKFYFQKIVSNILNRDKTDLCPFEKLSLDKTPEEFYNFLKQKCLS